MARYELSDFEWKAIEPHLPCTVPANRLAYRSILNNFGYAFLRPWTNANNSLFHALSFSDLVINPITVCSVHSAKDQHPLEQVRFDASCPHSGPLRFCLAVRRDWGRCNCSMKNSARHSAISLKSGSDRCTTRMTDEDHAVF